MGRPDLLTRMRRICLALPDTEESSRLGGSPHFYVRGKIFAGCGEEDGRTQFGVKVGLDLQSLLIERSGFHVAKYVGRHGWISVDEVALEDDDELEHLVRISYDLIAGKRAGKAGAKRKARKKARPAKTAAKRRPAKTATSRKPAKAARRRPAAKAAPRRRRR